MPDRAVEYLTQCDRAQASRLRASSDARCLAPTPDRLVSSFQQCHQIGFSLLDLIERALAGRFVGPPAHKPRPVPEALAGEMIVAHFDHERWSHRLPLAGALC